MGGTVIPNVPPQFFTNAGAVAAGHLLFSYEAGTTSKRNTYSDEALTTANANPIVLDSAGRATIFLSGNSYKFVLAPPTDTDPPTSPLWTRDNVTALAGFDVNVDILGTAGQSLLLNDVVYLSAGDGGLIPGNWYKADADLTYRSVSADAFGMTMAAISSGESGSIRIMGRVSGLTGKTAGAVQYVSSTAGLLTETAPVAPAFVKAFAVADSGTSVVINYHVPRPLAVMQVFTSNGTWTRNPKATTVQVVCIGAGGGGGSGRRGAAGTARFGGGGGAGAAYTLATLNASLLGTTETVTIGTSGTGGAGIAVDNTDGNTGVAGTSTTFGNWVIAAGGPAGTGGTAIAGQQGIANLTQCLRPGGNGGAGVDGVGANASDGNYFAAAGGGGGGGISAANANGNGGLGGAGSPARNGTLSGGAAGVVATSNGGNGTGATANEASGGGGGGGGAGGTTFGLGGNGGVYGAGGGGGGAVPNGTAGLAGGNGANGICIVIQS